jgi:hypothetical protein
MSSIPPRRRWRFADDLGFEAGVAVSGHVQLDGSDLGQHGLGSMSIARIAAVASCRITSRVAQVVGQLALEGAF